MTNLQQTLFLIDIESIPFKIVSKLSVPAMSLLLNVALDDIASSIRQEKEINSIKIGKEEMKLIFHTDMVL